MRLDRGQHKRRLDRLCRAVVMERDGHRCARCGATRKLGKQYQVVRVQWAHVHTRGWLALRWDPDNSMALCARCHLMWHGTIPGHEREMRGWWEATYPERACRLNLALRTRHKVDVALIEVALRRDFRALTGLDWAGA